MAKHQRSLKNLLISPVEQFAFGFRILIAPLMVVLIMGLAFLQPVINQSKMLAPHLAPEHRMDLQIASAHITTFGEKVIDTFYVTDLTGAKIENPTRQDTVRKRLIATLEGVVHERAKTKAAAE